MVYYIYTLPVINLYIFKSAPTNNFKTLPASTLDQLLQWNDTKYHFSLILNIAHNYVQYLCPIIYLSEHWFSAETTQSAIQKPMLHHWKLTTGHILDWKTNLPAKACSEIFMIVFVFNPLGPRPAAALSLWNTIQREVTVSNDPRIQL